jgi:hypothetical protein
MFTPKDALLLILLPLLLSLAGGAAAFLSRRSKSSHAPAWPLILALTGAPLIAGLVAFTPTGLPKESFDWLILLPLLPLVAALIIHVLPTWTSLILFLLASLLSAYILGLHLPAESLPTFTFILIAFIPAILYYLLLPLAHRRPAPAFPALFLLLATATVIVELAGTFIKFGQYTVALPAALGALLLLQLFFRNFPTSKGILAAFLLLWSAALTYGYLWADVPAQRTLLLAVAPLTLWLATLPKSLSPFKRTILALLLVAIPLAFAACPAAKELITLLHSQTEVGQY